VEELARTLGGDRVGVHVLGCYPRCSFIESKIKAIGIIGGTGAMGRWFKTMFARAGYDVLIAGRNTDLTYAECVAHSDVVLINVPIRNTEEMISAIGPLLGKGQLLVDNTSIKTQPVAAMLKAAAAAVEVLGMHTVFGPQAVSLHGQNVVFTRTERSAELSEEFENIFYKHGARITYTDCEHHDRQMAFHQNLEHFTKLVLAEVLCETFDDPDSLDRFSSPNSRATLATIGRVLHIDLDLLAQIQSWNLQGPDMIRRFVDTATRLGQSIEKNDVHALQKSVERSAGQLGHRFLADMLARSKARDKV
jgi:prephenate dehydrogenase